MGDKYTSEGDNSQDISGKSVNIDKLEQRAVNNNCLESRDEIDRILVNVYRKTIWKFPLSVNQIFGLGCLLVSLLPLQVLSMVYFPKLEALPEWLMSISMPAMLLGTLPLLLAGGVKATDSPFNFLVFGNLETSEDGGLYFTRIGSKCHICSGPMKMKMVNTSEKDPIDLRLVCTHNPAHDIIFDINSLEDVATEYLARKRQEK